MNDVKIGIFSEDVEYDLSQFDCGEVSLNTFLAEHLKRQHREKFLRAYVLTTREENPQILGYYTLSGSCFEKAYLPSKTQQKRIPYKNVPSATLGRLAIDKRIQGQGFGELLVTHAMKTVYLASFAVDIHGLFVEALNDKARNFYLKLGFIPLLAENEFTLFLPTKTFESMFEE